MSGNGESSDEEDWMSTNWAAPLVTATTTAVSHEPSITTPAGSHPREVTSQGELKSFRPSQSGSGSISLQEPAKTVTSQPQGVESVVQKASLTDGVSMGSTCKPKLTAEGGKAEGDEKLVSLMKLNDNKAGMQGLDREKINQIIFEASKGSRYYENEQKKEQQIKQRIAQQQQRLNGLTTQQISFGEVQADMLLEKFELGRDLSRTIVHIDMDAFYAAVEMRDNPELRNKPMAVGGNSMLSTSNYLARRYGVRAAMPGFIGKKLCPSLVIVPTNFEKYHTISAQVREIFADYDPDFCPMSLDEAYLDITPHLVKRRDMTDRERTYTRSVFTGFCACHIPNVNPPDVASSDHQKQPSEQEAASTENKNHPPAEDSIFTSIENNDKYTKVSAGESESVAGGDSRMVAVCRKCGLNFPPRQREEVVFTADAAGAVNELRFRVEQRTRLTASAGIAPNTLIAKVCSDMNKPNGQYMVPASREAVLQFISQLPIRKVSGIGKVAEHMLSALGVTLSSDLHKHRGILYHLYSATSFQQFMRITLGIGSTVVQRDGERKSISVERTFSEIHVPADLYEKCRELSQSLAEDLTQENLMGKTVTIKLKTVAFEVRTRAQTLPCNSKSAEQIYAAASNLLRTEIQAALPGPLKLRLMGVRMSNLLHADQKPGGCISIVDAFKKVKENTAPEPVIADSTQPSGDIPITLPSVVDGTEQPSSDGEKQKKHSPGETILKQTSAGKKRKHSASLNSPNRQGNKHVFTCPVCHRDIKSKRLNIINIHIDRCLQGLNSSISTEQSSPERNCSIINESNCDSRSNVAQKGPQKNTEERACVSDDIETADDRLCSGEKSELKMPSKGSSREVISKISPSCSKIGVIYADQSGYNDSENLKSSHTERDDMSIITVDSQKNEQADIDNVKLHSAKSKNICRISAGPDLPQILPAMEDGGFCEAKIDTDDGMVLRDAAVSCTTTSPEKTDVSDCDQQVGMKVQNTRPNLKNSDSYASCSSATHGVKVDTSANSSTHSDEPKKSEETTLAGNHTTARGIVRERGPGISCDGVTAIIVEKTNTGRIASVSKSIPEAIPAFLTPQGRYQNVCDAAQPGPSKMTCPVCSEICDMDLPAFNAHVNICLNSEQNKSDTRNELVSAEQSSQSSYSSVLRDTNQSTDGESNRDACMSAPAGMLHHGDSSRVQDVDAARTSDGESDEGSTYICPICNIDRDVSSLEELNAHIDDCLNKRTVMDLVREENRTYTKKRRNESGGSPMDQVVKKRKECHSQIRPISAYFTSQQ